MNVERYSRPAIVLHWLIGIAIILNVALAWLWPVLPDAQVRPAIDWHKSVGITVLGLAIMRLLWRLVHRPPPHPRWMQQWESRLSAITHILLYVVMFGLPLTGWIMDSAWEGAADHPMIFMNLFEWPRIGFIMSIADPATKKMIHDGFGEAHEILAKLLYVLFALHVAGALKHQWLDRRPELQRMWFGR